ncbi:MAG: flagellar hook-basal body complex protein FliE [Deltaproteobacteria bacterium]|nr:flagellar hook-basal body complex protein FliE [Deltaproteobacteria bacterium]
MDSVRSISSNPLPRPEGAGPRKAGEGSFLDTLKGFQDQVDARIKEADRMREEFAVGARQDIHEIMIASEKADISFRLLLQIRNKLLEGYQEIMRMQF